jgi:hypothetical protein
VGVGKTGTTTQISLQPSKVLKGERHGQLVISQIQDLQQKATRAKEFSTKS